MAGPTATGRQRRNWQHREGQQRNTATVTGWPKNPNSEEGQRSAAQEAPTGGANGERPDGEQRATDIKRPKAPAEDATDGGAERMHLASALAAPGAEWAAGASTRAPTKKTTKCRRGFSYWPNSEPSGERTVAAAREHRKTGDRGHRGDRQAPNGRQRARTAHRGQQRKRTEHSPNPATRRAAAQESRLHMRARTAQNGAGRDALESARNPAKPPQKQPAAQDAARDVQKPRDGQEKCETPGEAPESEGTS